MANFAVHGQGFNIELLTLIHRFAAKPVNHWTFAEANILPSVMLLQLIAFPS